MNNKEDVFYIKVLEEALKKNKVNEFLSDRIITSFKKAIEPKPYKKNSIGWWLKKCLTTEEYENALICKENDWNNVVKYASSAVGCGFNWNNTVNGFDYWKNKYMQLLERGL